jgi:hypothetical protein
MAGKAEQRRCETDRPWRDVNEGRDGKRSSVEHVQNKHEVFLSNFGSQTHVRQTIPNYSDKTLSSSVSQNSLSTNHVVNHSSKINDSSRSTNKSTVRDNSLICRVPSLRISLPNRTCLSLDDAAVTARNRESPGMSCHSSQTPRSKCFEQSPHLMSRGESEASCQASQSEISLHNSVQNNAKACRLGVLTNNVLNDNKNRSDLVSSSGNKSIHTNTHVEFPSKSTIERRTDEMKSVSHVLTNDSCNVDRILSHDLFNFNDTQSISRTQNVANYNSYVKSSELLSRSCSVSVDDDMKSVISECDSGVHLCSYARKDACIQSGCNAEVQKHKFYGNDIAIQAVVNVSKPLLKSVAIQADDKFGKDVSIQTCTSVLKDVASQACVNIVNEPTRCISKSVCTQSIQTEPHNSDQLTFRAMQRNNAEISCQTERADVNFQKKRKVNPSSSSIRKSTEDEIRRRNIELQTGTHWWREQILDPDVEAAKNAYVWVDRGSWEAVSKMSTKRQRLWREYDVLTLKDGILQRIFYKPVGEIHQIVVPSHLVTVVIKANHDHDHAGCYRTQSNIKDHFYWPGWKSDVSKYIKGCETCKSKKNSSLKSDIPLTKSTSDKVCKVNGLKNVEPQTISNCSVKKQSEANSQHSVNLKQLDPNQPVFLYKFARRKRPPKFSKWGHEPFKIVEALKSDLYRIAIGNGNARRVVHRARLFQSDVGESTEVRRSPVSSQ